MRLSRLHLRNFRTFLDLELDFDDLTVFVGPNDAGKSTLLDAVRCLLSPHDYEGNRWRRQAVESRPRQFAILDHPSRWEAEYSPWGEEHVSVVGTFSDLGVAESQAWGEAVVDGLLTVGVYFEPIGTTPGDHRFGPYLVWAHDKPLPRMRPVAFSPRKLEDAPRFDPGVQWLDIRIGERYSDRPDDGWPRTTVPFELPTVVGLGGPERTPLPIARLVTPIVDVGVDRLLERIPAEVRDLIEESLFDVEHTVSKSLKRSVPHYLENATGARIYSGPWSVPGDVLRRALRAPLEELGVSLQRRLGAGDHRDWDQEDDASEDGAWRDTEPEQSLGAGARRATSLAALELYADPDVWPADRSVAILIEEPEVGLHPSAQRRVATALNRLSGVAGVSVLIVTHSPVIINAADLHGVRLVRPPQEIGRVVRPEALQEIADLLGAEPADVLLGEAFVVVEGPSDVPIFTAWARRLGMDLDRRGVKLVDAKGWTKADVVAELLRLTYPAARFHIILDGGTEIAPEVDRLRIKNGGRVHVHQLAYREVEAYFSERAIRAWVAASSGRDVDVSRLQESRERGEVARWLGGIAHRDLHRKRGYDKVSDGLAIAALMTEAEIAPEIKGILVTLAGA